MNQNILWKSQSQVMKLQCPRNTWDLRTNTLKQVRRAIYHYLCLPVFQIGRVKHQERSSNFSCREKKEWEVHPTYPALWNASWEIFSSLASLRVLRNLEQRRTKKGHGQLLAAGATHRSQLSSQQMARNSAYRKGLSSLCRSRKMHISAGGMNLKRQCCFQQLDQMCRSEMRCITMRLLQEAEREVEVVTNVLASQCTVLEKTGGWLSVLSTAQQDWKKTYNPDTSLPGRRDRSGICTSYKKVWETSRTSSQADWLKSFHAKASFWNWKRWLLIQKCTHKHRAARNTKNEENITLMNEK